MNPTNRLNEAFTELSREIYTSLETYSNVHRGSGYNSIMTTRLFDNARNIILEYLGLSKKKYVVIFCTPRRAEMLCEQLATENYTCLSSRDFGLPFGVRAIAVKRTTIPGNILFETGGGTARLISRNWVIWAKTPDKFEAGTPAIVNIIAFAKALQIIRKFGIESFKNITGTELTAQEILYHDELEQFAGREMLDKLRHTLIGRYIRVPTFEGVKPFINLDNAASTPTFEPIWNAVKQTWLQTPQKQQEIVHEVKSVCANALGAPLTTYDTIFTSNTTEAINLVAKSLGKDDVKDIEPIVLNTLLEHNSNEIPWRMIPGYSLIHLSIDSNGFVNLQELEKLLDAYNQKGEYGKKRIRLFAVSGASNVLGTINNLEEISKIVHRYGARLFVDAAQLVAHRKVEMEKWGIDYLVFSAHKMYAPFGSGALVVKKGLLNFNSDEFKSIISSGEENTLGIAAIGKAFILLQRIGFDLIQEEEQKLTAYTLSGLAKIPDIKIHGIKDPESPQFTQKGGVIAFSVKKVFPDKVAKRLSERGGIGVRYGCHCTHILVKRLNNIPAWVERLQWVIISLAPKLELPGVVRVSLGIENTKEEIDAYLLTMDKIARNSKVEESRNIDAVKI